MNVAFVEVSCYFEPLKSDNFVKKKKFLKRIQFCPIFMRVLCNFQKSPFFNQRMKSGQRI